MSTLLRAWIDGERLTHIVDDELPRLARRYMNRDRPGHSLQTTALMRISLDGASVVARDRDWSTARAWLYRELTGGAGDGF